VDKFNIYYICREKGFWEGTLKTLGWEKVDFPIVLYFFSKGE
jgi:hypothetical protein